MMSNMSDPTTLDVLTDALDAHMSRTGQSVADVAVDLGVNVATVCAWFARCRPRDADDEFEHIDTRAKLGRWLRARIAESGCTVREIADTTECVSLRTIYGWIRGDHLPLPPTGEEPDRFDLVLSNPRLGLNLRQRLKLDEVRRRLTGTSTRMI
jgi:transposase-like protein